MAVDDWDNPPGGGEPDASRVSPLLGTNRLQQGVDRFSSVLGKVSETLVKAADRYAARMQDPTRGGTPAGVGNPSTLGGGRPLGGGATFSGQGQTLGGGTGNGGHGPGVFMPVPPIYPKGSTMPPAPWNLPQGPIGAGPGAPPPNNGGWAPKQAAQWSRYGGYAGMALGGYAMSKALDGVPELAATNTTAQLMARGSNMGAFQIRSALTRGNFSAVSDTDAMQGGSNLMRSGYAIGSSGYNSLSQQAKNYNTIDPSATFDDVTRRLTAFAGPAAGNFLLTRGVQTRDAKGNLLNATSTADSIIKTANLPGVKDAKGYGATWGPSGTSNMFVQAIQQSMGDDAAKMVEDRLRGQQQARIHHMDLGAYTKATQTGDWATLGKYGFKKTDTDVRRDVDAAKRNITDNTAQGFSAGLQDASKALTEFYDVLDKVTHGPLGDLLGNAKGAAGASGALTSALDVGSSLAGGYLGSKLAGSLASNGAGGTAAAARAAASSAARGGAGLLGQTSVAAGAGVAGAGLVVLNAGRSVFNTALSDDERHSRKAQLQAQGQGDFMSSVNSWSETFNNNFLLGLPDAIGANHSKGGTGGKAMDGNGGGPSTGGSKTGSSSATSGIAPVSGFKISAPFGHYSNGKPHHGVDFACPIGTPVKANRSGKVIKAGWDNGGFGNHVRIDSGDGLIEIYGHMSRVSVKEGQTIAAGTLLGLSGDTGHVTGPHLHFEVRKGGSGIGNAVDPMPYLNSSGGVTPGTPSGSPTVASGATAQSKSAMSGPGGASAGIPWGINEAELVASGLASTPGGPSGSTSGDTPSSGSTGVASTPASGATGPLRGILSKAGFTGSALGMAYAIMMAESHGNAHAHNTNAKTGDNSYGLFQINMLGGMGPERRARWHLGSNDALFDPLTNAKVAYDMSRHGTDWHDWSTYKRGDYKQYLGGQTKSYDVGSTNIDVDQNARVHKGEMIIDPVTADELRKRLSTNSPTSLFGGKGKGGGVHIDKIELHTSQPFTDSAATDLAKQFLAMIANDAQMQTLMEG